MGSPVPMRGTEGGFFRHPQRSIATTMERALCIALALLAFAAVAQQQLSRAERKARISKLPEQHRQFLLDVEPIIQAAEENAFLLLDSDAQRDVFIAAFWKRHAPE